MAEGFQIRLWREDDDVESMTALLHRAYAALAERGLRFTATHQAPEVTRRRLENGIAYVAEDAGRVVGTATLYRPEERWGVPLYREPGVWHFGQFGVEPEWKGHGIGRALHETLVARAREDGAEKMAMDTAAPAEELIATYRRWGYEVVDRIKFDSVNYESVILCLSLKGSR